MKLSPGIPFLFCDPQFGWVISHQRSALDPVISVYQFHLFDGTTSEIVCSSSHLHMLDEDVPRRSYQIDVEAYCTDLDKFSSTSTFYIRTGPHSADVYFNLLYHGFYESLHTIDTGWKKSYSRVFNSLSLGLSILAETEVFVKIDEDQKKEALEILEEIKRLSKRYKELDPWFKLIPNGQTLRSIV